MHKFRFEDEMFLHVINHYKNKGYTVIKEVNIGYCRADIIAFHNGKVTAIELKLNNWKKAIIQAKNYQLATDYVYIAFPLSKSYNILRKARYILENEGIGLIVINEKSKKINEIINSKPSRRKISIITLDVLNKNRNHKYKKYY